MVWSAVAEQLDRDGFEPDSWILMGALALPSLRATTFTSNPEMVWR